VAVCHMQTPPHKAVVLDRMNDGLSIYFQDGKRGFFADEVPYELLCRAEPIGGSFEDQPSLAY
jgi:hypothetical protein